MKAAGMQALVRGRVQGVGFRWYVHAKAKGLDVTGGVRNLRDGRVEVVAEGPQEDLDRLVEILRQGPSGSSVDDVAVTPQSPAGSFGAFEIWPTR